LREAAAPAAVAPRTPRRAPSPAGCSLWALLLGGGFCRVVPAKGGPAQPLGCAPPWQSRWSASSSPRTTGPDFLREALLSACAQTHTALDIVISDNGSGAASEASRDSVADLLESDARIRYLRCPERDHYLDNWLFALSQARGDYVGFLMDDDLYHPDKVARMLPLLAGNPDVALVTSFRQLIDASGKELPPLPETQPLFGADAVVSGDELGNRILQMGANVVGEPTTVLLRRADLGASFGFFCGRQYQVISDVATWLQLMQGRRVVYLRDALSKFRLHGGQDQRRALQALNANVEWLQMLLDANAAGLYLERRGAVPAHPAPPARQPGALLTKHADAVRSSATHAEPIQRVLRQAFDRLFHA
jgi:hypothetical protein